MRPDETAWRRGRFDARAGPGRVLFGRMYEDAAVELGAFRPGGRVLAIASAGCTAMALAPRHEVVAVDINPVQLDYAERRFAGEPPVRGAAERVMGLGRALAPLAGWSRRRLGELLALDDPQAQIDLFRRRLDTRRFRAAFDALLTAAALRAVYASPFLGFLPRRFGAVLRGRMERCLARHSNRSNPYARALLLGELPRDPAPPEARSIRAVCADAAAYLESAPAGAFDGFALSNILDGASPSYARRLVQAVRRAAAPGAVVVLRSFREPVPSAAAHDASVDRAMLWGVVDVRPADRLDALEDVFGALGSDDETHTQGVTDAASRLHRAGAAAPRR